MFSIVVILLAFNAQADVKELLANHVGPTRGHNTKVQIVDDLVNKLMVRLLDNAAFRKPCHLANLLCTSPLYRTPGVLRVGVRPCQVRGLRSQRDNGILGAANCANVQPTIALPLTRRQAGLATFLGGAVTAAIQVAPALAEEAGFKDAPEGVKYKDLIVGDGEVPENTNVVTVDFDLVLLADGTKADSGRIVFAAGGNQVVRGFDMAMLGNGEMPPMQVGGVRKVIVPPELGFGPAAKGFMVNANTDDEKYVFIPRDSTLEYTIKFVSMEKRIFNAYAGDKPATRDFTFTPR